jgi:hypothetical protein
LVNEFPAYLGSGFQHLPQVLGCSVVGGQYDQTAAAVTNVLAGIDASRFLLLEWEECNPPFPRLNCSRSIGFYLMLQAAFAYFGRRKTKLQALGPIHQFRQAHFVNVHV